MGLIVNQLNFGPINYLGDAVIEVQSVESEVEVEVVELDTEIQIEIPLIEIPVDDN